VTGPPPEPLHLVAGDLVPVDAEVVEGQASVDEAAVTGESAPVLREARPGHDTVLAGTRLSSGWLRVRPLPAPLLPRRPARAAPAWWPAAVLGLGIAAVLLTRSGPPRVLALAVLGVPILALAARRASAEVETAFWRRLRVLPLAAGALRRAARCDTLLVTAEALEAGRLVAVDLLPLRGVSAAEVAAAVGGEGSVGRSVRRLARRRGVPEGASLREPLCGPVPEVARQVAARGGVWPAAARDAEIEVAARGGRCLAAADGGRPLGLIELRPVPAGPSVEDGLRAGLALSLLHDPAQLGAAAALLQARRRRCAVAWEDAAGTRPPQASFVLAGTAWAAARPSALDLDGDGAKLPAVVLGARRLYGRSLALQAVAATTDALRAAAALRAATLALRGPAAGWAGPSAGALLFLASATVLAVLAGLRGGQG